MDAALKDAAFDNCKTVAGKFHYQLDKLSTLAGESDYCAALMAKKLGISVRQFQRMTQKLFDASPQRWLEQLRLSRAPALVFENQSVKIAAAQLGFRQPSHFSRRFKSYYGYPPVAAKKSGRVTEGELH